MTETKYSPLIKRYLLGKMDLPINEYSISIDKELKLLNRIRESKKVEMSTKKIDYLILNFLEKYGR